MPRKKTFPCGHSGQGQYCHRCQQAAAAEQKRVQASAEKAAWKATLKHDVIDLSSLPSPKLIEKARQILANLEQHSYTHYNGKRMNYDRSVISIPLGRDYRLLLREKDGKLHPLKVMSHEEYNATTPGSSLL